LADFDLIANSNRMLMVLRFLAPASQFQYKNTALFLALDSSTTDSVGD
jgi:hypothetical protein